MAVFRDSKNDTGPRDLLITDMWISHTMLLDRGKGATPCGNCIRSCTRAQIAAKMPWMSSPPVVQGAQIKVLSVSVLVVTHGR